MPIQPEKEIKLPVRYSTLGNPIVKNEVKRQYGRLQNHLCMWCKLSLYGEPAKEVTAKPINWNLFPPNFLKYPIHLQHNHKTDMTEGVVHAYCNAVMWQYHGR